jgi:hypothetical protein
MKCGLHGLSVLPTEKEEKRAEREQGSDSDADVEKCSSRLNAATTVRSVGSNCTDIVIRDLYLLLSCKRGGL